MNSGHANTRSPKTYLRNGVILCILLVGIGLTLLRFTGGIGSVSNLSDKTPWGFWTAFDLLCGIALSAGGFAVAAAYYIFGRKDFHVYVRAALTTAFLGYFFEVIALIYEVGQPWRLVYPFFLSQGTTSVLFLVALCVALYLAVLGAELLPALFERIGKRKARETAVSLAAPLAVVGATVAIIHQSALGALYLIAPSKMHPLWHSAYMPLFFLLSAISAGFSMVIIEGMLAHTFMREHMDAEHIRESDKAALICGRIIPALLCVSLIAKCAETAVSGNLPHLASSYGLLFLLELAGGIALPVLLYCVGIKKQSLFMTRTAAILTVLGVVLNRFNVSLVAFNYNLPPVERYVPHWMEVGISVFLVMLLILSYRFLCSNLPILKGYEK